MKVIIIASYIQDDNIVNSIVKVDEQEQNHSFMIAIYEQLLFNSMKGTAREDIVKQSINDIISGIVEDSNSDFDNIVNNIMKDLQTNFDSLIIIKGDNVEEVFSNKYHNDGNLTFRNNESTT